MEEKKLKHILFVLAIFILLGSYFTPPGYCVSKNRSKTFVIYVDSELEGAEVYLNDNQVFQEII